MTSIDNPDPSDWICLGTRLVVLLNNSTNPASAKNRPPPSEKTMDGGDEDDPPKARPLAPEGLLVLYQSKQTTNSKNPPTLRIEVGTNQSVYRSQQPVDWSRVRLPESPSVDSKASVFSNVLLLLQDGGRDSHPDMTVRLEHSSSTLLELVIQQKLPSGLQKYIYKETLLSSSSSSSGVLAFSHALGVAVNGSVQERRALTKQVEELQRSMNAWKATAQRLSTEVWQKEKDQLVHNFVRLWNEKQKREKKQFQELMEELEHTKKELDLLRTTHSGDTTNKKRGRHLKLDDEVAKGADDDLGGGREPIPLEEVAALAAGRKPARGKRAASSNILTAQDTISAATLLEQQKAYEKQKREEKKAKAKTVVITKKARDDIDRDNGSDEEGRGKRETKATVKKNVTEETETVVADKPTARRNTRIIKPSSLSSSDSDTDDIIESAPPKKRPRSLEEDALKTKKTSPVTAPPPRTALAASKGNDESSVENENSEDERYRAQIRAQLSRMKHTLSSSDEE